MRIDVADSEEEWLGRIPCLAEEVCRLVGNPATSRVVLSFLTCHVYA